MKGNWNLGLAVSLFWRAYCWSLSCRIRRMKMIAKGTWLGMYCLALLAAPRAGAGITKEQAVLYVQTTWGLFDLSSDVISETLDASYSGVPYASWIDFLVNAPSWVQPLASGDYSTAARAAYNYAAGAAVTELISECGLAGVAAPAALAVWPIRAALNNVIDAVNDKAFKDQCRLYFLARKAPNNYTYEQIAAHSAQNITFTTGDYWLYIVADSHEIAGYPRWSFASSSRFYEYAETLFQASEAAGSFDSASRRIAQQFHDDAVAPAPAAPTIAVQPSSMTVSVGDTANFTVVAHGTWPLHYQWQRNGVDISDATSWFYVTPALQMANNGDQYSVRVSNAQGSRNSSAATLVVSGATQGSLAITTVSPPTLTGLPLPQTQALHIYGSGFTSSSTLLFNGSIPSDAVRLHLVSANQIDYDIRTDTSDADWTVRVVNGTQQSNLGYFKVASPTPNTGSLTVNLSPEGAVAVGAQWTVDSGTYHNKGDTISGLTPGVHTVSFKAVAGYTPPANQSVTITGGAVTTATATYTAITPTTYTLTLNQSDPTQGGVSVSPRGSGDGSLYSAGALVRLTASASLGYHFAGWGGDLSGTESPATMKMDGNKTVSATFASGDPNIGTVMVTILPPEAAAAGVKWGWNEKDYRDSGTSVTCYPGTFILTIHPVDGWLGPTQKTVTFVAGQTTEVKVIFTQDTTPGLLTVTLSPQDAVTAGGKWHVNGSAAQGAGATVSLPPGGGYTVTFDSVPGWQAPATQTVTVQRAQTTVVAGNYTAPPGQPVIAAIHPSFGALEGGTALTIEGVNFTAPASVLIGGKSATSVSVLSASQIVCFTPSSSTYGTMPVVVQTPGGSARNPNGFTYGAERGNGIELVTSLGGQAYGVAVQGNYAYIGEGSSLLVLNISNPSSPSLVGRLAMPGMVRDIALLGQYAYVANGDAGLQVVDISDPAAPGIKGFYATPGWAYGITILGGKAYVAEGAGLDILDLSNPTFPDSASFINIPSGLTAVALKVTTSGVFAYNMSFNGYLYIVDVSQPLSPVLRGNVNTGGIYASSIAVLGNLVFVASPLGLRTIDISDPDAPAARGQVLNVGARSVAVANDLVYAADNSIFTIVSYSGGVPTVVARSFNIASPGYDSVVEGSRVYLAGGTSGLQIVDVSNSANPSQLSSFSNSGLFGNYNSCGLSGNYLCASVDGNFKVFDVTVPSQPTIVGQLLGHGEKVLARNGIAYLTGGDTRIIDISTPSSLQVKASIPSTTVFGNNMALEGNMLYVAGQDYEHFNVRFAAIDVSAPASPVVRGTKDVTTSGNGSTAGSVAVKGNKAVVGIQSVEDQSGVTFELRVLDISDAAAPLQRGTLVISGYPFDIQMSADGRYAYVAGADKALRVVDVGDMSNPFEVRNVSGMSQSSQIGLQGNLLYVTGVGEFSGVQVFDVSNPTDPVLIKSYRTPGGAYGLALLTDPLSERGTIFVADSDAGLVVLRTKDTVAPEVFITDPIFSATYTTTMGTLNLGGTASDNVGLIRVAWSNERGGGGDASGRENWFVRGITLYPGQNILTVTAFDQAGNKGSDALAVTYQAPKQEQTITFSPVADRTFGGAPVPLTAAASSGLPVSFSIVSGPASLANNVLSLGGAGVVRMLASQAGNDFFNPAPAVEMSFNVAKAEQSIAFAPMADKSAGDPPFVLGATASSGLPVYFDLVSGPALVDANVVTLLGAGVVTLSAWQPGNPNYNSALTVQRSFTVARIPQTVSFGPLSPQRVGDAPFALSASASSGLPVTFLVASGPAVVSGNIVTLTGSGLVVLRASQAGNATYSPAPKVDQALSVAPGNNVITDAQQLANGMFSFRFYGESGKDYFVQASMDLVNWVLVSTNHIGVLGYLEFMDDSATKYDIRFYRAVVQEVLPSTGNEAFSEEFNANDAGYAVVNTATPPPGPWVYDSGSGKWVADGGEDACTGPDNSQLNSPAYKLTQDGFLSLAFTHRYSFEGDYYDGGQVRISVNGGAFTPVPAANFTANGYAASNIVGAGVLNGQRAFNADSPGYSAGEFITSKASLGTFSKNDTIVLQFLGAWDECSAGKHPNWVIDGLDLELLPMIIQDFAKNDGGFTVTNTATPPPGPWVYDAVGGVWTADGSEDACTGPYNSTLNSPAYGVPQNDEATLTFVHRYSFESGLYDGGQVRISVNGGAFTPVPAENFTANGYADGAIVGNGVLLGQRAFNANSPGYATTNFITSSVLLGTFNKNDTIVVQFLGAWDECSCAARPSWVIKSLQVAFGKEP